MNSKSLASVAFAVLGVVALLFSVSILQGLLAIPYFPEEFEGKTSVIFLAYVFPFVLLVVTGVLLITHRFRLASWVSPKDQQVDTEESWREMPDLAFAVLGLFLVLSTLPSLGSLAGQLINLRASPSLQDFLPAFWTNVGHYLGTLAQLVAGAYLFMNARGVGRRWRRRGQTPTVVVTPPPRTCPECGTPFRPADYRKVATERRCSKCRIVLPEGDFE